MRGQLLALESSAGCPVLERLRKPGSSLKVLRRACALAPKWGLHPGQPKIISEQLHTLRPHQSTMQWRTPWALLLVALSRIVSASNSSLRVNAYSLGLEVLVDPVVVPAAPKTFWSIAYPEAYFNPQCHGKPRMVIEDCECACNALGGTLASIESQAQNDLIAANFLQEEPADDYGWDDNSLVIGAYQRTTVNAYKGWR